MQCHEVMRIPTQQCKGVTLERQQLEMGTIHMVSLLGRWGVQLKSDKRGATWEIIIFHSRDLGKMSEENTHLECKFLGHERPLGLK